MKYYWTTKDGDRLDVDQMTLTHLRNILKMILRGKQVRRQPTSIEARFKEDELQAEFNHLEDLINNEFQGMMI